MTNFQVWVSDTEPKPVVDMKHVSDNHILIYSFVRTIYPKKFFFSRKKSSFITMVFYVHFKFYFSASDSVCIVFLVTFTILIVLSMGQFKCVWGIIVPSLSPNAFKMIPALFLKMSKTVTYYKRLSKYPRQMHFKS